MDYTPDEIMVVCMARQIRDGETVAQGIATPLVAAAFLLARYTHAPNLYFASAIGQGLCRQPAPLSLLMVESMWLDLGLYHAGFARAIADVLPSLKPKEFFRPAQVDPFGNFNNIAFGSSYTQPRLRLPGPGGIPDVTTFLNDTYLYVPRHSRVTFVPELDFRSGLGNHLARTHGSGPQYLITDLGQFDFLGHEGETTSPGRLRLISRHPGVTINQIKARTGFPVIIVDQSHETEPPSIDELKLLRKDIDPLGIRRLELLSGSERRNLLRQIVQLESNNTMLVQGAIP
jgi:acyl CoA:acetate/3-ketoacid CoA transferase beta subunit